MYIAIAGNIGSGKTSLTEILSKRFGITAHYEDIDKYDFILNPEPEIVEKIERKIESIGKTKSGK